MTQCHLLFPLWSGIPRPTPPVGLSGDTMRLIWLGDGRVQGDPRGPGGPPYL
jgi:hypothetical protein